MFELFELRKVFIGFVDSFLGSIHRFFLSWNEIPDSESDNTEYLVSNSDSEEEEEDNDTLTVCSETELDDLCISDSDSDSEIDNISCPVWPNTTTVYSEPDYCPRLVSLEGNIGAGKTTLIRKLQEKYKNSKNILFLPEPVAFWQTFIDSKTGKNILDLFYENPKKYAFAFQMLAFQSRYELLRTMIENIRKEGLAIDTIVMERSLDADYHIFAKTMFENGTLEETEWEIYRFVTRERLAEFGVSGIIWLDVPATECYNRVQERAREEEGGLTLDYLRGCEEAHREWLSADLGFVCRVEDGLHSEEDMDAIETYLF
jgi:deoxyadenosine/deoxycytidine kinase